MVPIDDTNTMFIELRHVSDDRGRDAGLVGRPRADAARPVRPPIPMRKASVIPAISRRRCRSARSRSMGSNISALPTAASRCSATRYGAASAPCATASDPEGLAATTVRHPDLLQQHGHPYAGAHRRGRRQKDDARGRHASGAELSPRTAAARADGAVDALHPLVFDDAAGARRHAPGCTTVDIAARVAPDAVASSA